MSLQRRQLLALGAGLAGAGAIPLAIAGLRWLEAASQRRKAQQLAAQLPGCLELFAAALDAGVPLRAAVRHVAALAPEPSAGLLRGVLGHLEIAGECGVLQKVAALAVRRHGDLGPGPPIHLGQLVAAGMAGDVNEVVPVGQHLDPLPHQAVDDA
mgnify:CR=1 FL=1